MVRPWMNVRIASKQLAADDIYLFGLETPDGDELPTFSAGSHIDVEVKPGLVRQYSLCNHPEERDRYEIAVLLDPDTRGGSAGIHESWAEGDTVRISEPRNHFALVGDAKKSILLAGGIGVTPILCMAERLAHADEPFEMHYCTRNQARTAFYDRIRNSPLSDRVNFYFDDAPEAERFDPSRVLASPEEGVHLYVCGPAGFIDWIYAAAEEHGWPAAQLHREYFAPPDDPDADAGDFAFDVKIASTGQTITIPADKSVAATLEEHGIEIAVSCEQGVCGTCITHILEGEPDHRDMILSDADTDQFTPCCSRARTRLLVLDL